MHQGLLEPRTCHSKTNPRGILPQIEAFTIRFRFAEQKPQAPPQIRSAQQKRASAWQTWTGFDQNDRSTRGNIGEKLFRPVCVESDLAVELEHELKDTRATRPAAYAVENSEKKPVTNCDATRKR